MGATKIMVIRHAEKPADPPTADNPGLNPDGSVPPDLGPKLLTARGWQRARALLTLFAPPSGPKPHLATPRFLFASNPDAEPGDDPGSDGPSQRPYETLSPLSATLGGLMIDATVRKKHYAKMVKHALECQGVVLIAWQHTDIPLVAKDGLAGMSQEILTQTGTPGALGIPRDWPDAPNGPSRFDLVFVFDRPSGTGPITGFTQVPQMLLPGDGPV